MRKWPLGSIVNLEEVLNGKWEDFVALGLDTCQMRTACDIDVNNAELLAKTRDFAASIPMPSAVMGWSGVGIWDFVDGPRTLGVVPVETRARRVAELKNQLAFCGKAGIRLTNTHIGFVPENPSDPAYESLVETVADLGRFAESVGTTLNMETGQETCVTLKRLILDAGSPALGINLDPANLLMYGKSNPMDAADVFGELVRSVHVKDGCYPTGDMKKLGEEKAFGSGMVNFGVLFDKLAKKGFNGPLIIEREISGPQQIEDIKLAISLVDSLIGG